jgi:putative transposase
VRRIMKRAGLQAIYPGKNLSKPSKYHKKYLYLLRNKKIWLPNQVWASDITYVRLSGGNVYLVAIVDLYSRKVLSWRLSNTMDTEFCVEALKEAIMNYGVPAIFNTDQGSQFTSAAFIEVLEFYGVRISMDGVNRAVDNIYVERLWRSLKYEEIYLKEYGSMAELKLSIKKYFIFYNSERYNEPRN